MKFIVTSGGTAGHIYPALAVAAELIQGGHELLFAGTPAGLEARLAAADGLSYKAFAAAGFNRSRPWTLLTSSLRLGLSGVAARSWLAHEKPAAVAGFGGYASLPTARAAAALGIPLLIHEQNSTPGWANRHLARQAQAVALSYEAARAALAVNPAARVELTGNPVRAAFLKAVQPGGRTQAREAFRQQLGIPARARVLLVFGGSQGARHINQAIVALAGELMAVAGLHLIQITGPGELAAVKEALAAQQVVATVPAAAGVATPAAAATAATSSAPALAPSAPAAPATPASDLAERWHLMGYCDDMAAAYAASDMVVARAGAGSLAEIAAMGLPSLLVPYPYATNDHQTTNARSLVEAGAAVMVGDAELDTPQFARTLLGVLADVQKQSKMQHAARALAPANAAATVARLLLSIAAEPQV
ncbi:MAG: UDP-N-acetylglucosamine--N-acetylmuramyl-(pentapeptide) pyrophosphoryl-undecaprenol N-acetylglucosamine transferase [Coriobacteriales bacterium]|jgi:UDP-N-acetylglucosamine--N-acetylmuramyl-(pentapeptide) pyrophosphoryl-undecaprenol N-acetylglucosamine transferase|nr:UDP-N-acetylglucosamine--N-acetylmuramyl-(pentapeptide) pyrophosphoryl-undecaprenol N-acetylglucosamine transferase [Coriobacteriales bacterium]